MPMEHEPTRRSPELSRGYLLVLWLVLFGVPTTLLGIRVYGTAVGVGFGVLVLVLFAGLFVRYRRQGSR